MLLMFKSIHKKLTFICVFRKQLIGERYLCFVVHIYTVIQRHMYLVN